MQSLINCHVNLLKVHVSYLGSRIFFNNDLRTRDGSKTVSYASVNIAMFVFVYSHFL